MIRNKLTVLLAEKNIRANRVSNDTGIARSTLSSLTNNSSKMIQLETINSICQYLNVSPADFFEYVPFDFDYYSEIGELDQEAYKENHSDITYPINAFLNITENFKKVAAIEFSGDITDFWYATPLDEQNNIHTFSAIVKPIKDSKALKPYIDQLSPSFNTQVIKDFTQVIEQSLVEKEIVDSTDEIKSDIVIKFA